MKVLTGYSFTTTAETGIVGNVKKTLLHVVYYDTKLKLTAESSDRFIPLSSQTVTSSLSAPYVSAT